MRIHNAVLCALLAIFAAGMQSQSAQTEKGTDANHTAAIAGVWKAQMDGLPAIALTISDEGGSFSGAVLFYLHRREEGKPVTVTPGIPEPVFNLRFDGQTLTFQVSHRRAHPPSTLNDPPVSFRVKLTAPNRAILTNESDASPEFELVRSDY
jgi:hypothetical protein